MDEAWSRALRPILHDLYATTDLRLRFEPYDGWPGRRLGLIAFEPDGTGTGIYLSPDESADNQILEVLDQIQEIAAEALARYGLSNWPRCPHHPSLHPMTVHGRRNDPGLYWVCPRDIRKPIAALGQLDPS